MRVCDVEWWLVVCHPGPGVHIWGAAVWYLHSEAGHKPDTGRGTGVGGRGTGGGSHKYFVIPFRWLQLSSTLISLKYLKQRTVKTAESRKTFPTVVCWCECPPPWVSRWSLSSWLVTMESPSPPVNTILTVLIPSLALTGTNCHNCSLNDPLFVPITPVGSRP